jgi:hypothetical protein
MTVDTEIIEDDIDRIRQRMEARFDQLNHDLQPSQLVNGLLGNGGASANHNAALLVEKAKANPIAATVVGIGLAGLFLAKQSKDTGTVSDEDFSDPAQRVSNNISGLKCGASETADKLRGQAKATQAKVQTAVNGVKHKVDAASTAASDTFSEVAKIASETAKRAPTHAKAHAEKTVDWVKENPVPTGLMALAVGAAISSFFTAKPSTSRLDASKQLHEDARNFGEKTKSKKTTKSKAIKSASTAKKKVKPKPIPTRVAKARNIQGKPDTAVSAATANG